MHLLVPMYQKFYFAQRDHCRDTLSLSLSLSLSHTHTHTQIAKQVHCVSFQRLIHWTPLHHYLARLISRCTMSGVTVPDNDSISYDRAVGHTADQPSLWRLYKKSLKMQRIIFALCVIVLVTGKEMVDIFIFLKLRNIRYDVPKVARNFHNVALSELSKGIKMFTNFLSDTNFLSLLVLLWWPSFYIVKKENSYYLSLQNDHKFKADRRIATGKIIFS